MRDAEHNGPAPARAYDETGLPGECLPQYELIRRWLDETPRDAIELKRRESLDVRSRPHPREIALYFDA